MAEEPEELVFIKNQKGGQCLMWSGYRFTKNHDNASDGTTLWRCVDRNCNASLKLNADKNAILKSSVHACWPNLTKNKISSMIEECKTEVCKTFQPVQQIFEKIYTKSNITSDDEDMLPIYKSKKDTLLRARRRFLKAPKLVFKNLNEVVVPDIFHDFLVCDQGKDNDKILIFATPFGKTILQNLAGKSPQLFADGTFKRTPRPFYQLYTIHLDIASGEEMTNIVPLIYALLPNKTQETYVRLYLLIKEHFNIEFHKMKCDYELAQVNALQKVFPNIDISGCYYHYNKAIWKQADKLKMLESKKARHTTALIANLPLLPTQHIMDGWFAIVQEDHTEYSDAMQNFRAYFERQWLKLLPKVLSCASETNRTNNGLEGWHRRINARIPPNATFVLFLEKLLAEAKWQNVKIKAALFEKNNRKKTDVQFNKEHKRELQKLAECNITPLKFMTDIIKIRRRIFKEH